MKLINRFRENKMPIFFVHVDFKNAVPLMTESDSTLNMYKEYGHFILTEPVNEFHSVGNNGT